MSPKNYERKTRKMPYVRVIHLGNNNRTKRNSPKLCPDCKETTNCVKLFSNKVNRIEEIINDFYENPPKIQNKGLSSFNAKFNLNSVPCELEDDLSSFTLENLQKLVIITTQNFTLF